MKNPQLATLAFVMTKRNWIVLFLLFLTHLSISQHSNISLQADSLKTDSVKGRDFNLNGGFKVNSADFNKGAIFSPLQLIQGKVPGMAIAGMNGNDPTPDIQMQIRGTNALFTNTSPLYVVDGILLQGTDNVLPEDIESIEVIKNLASTALYGIRGSNGVVLITTRKNKSRKLHVNYSTYGYVESFSNKYNYLTGSEWRQLKDQWAESPYSSLRNLSSSYMNDYHASTNWLKEISQNKISQAHQLGVSGGFKKTSYEANFHYNDFHGIIQKTGSRIYNGRLKLSQLALKDRLQVDLMLGGTSKEYHQITANPYLNSTNENTGKTYSNIILDANTYNPTVPVFLSDGSFARDTLELRFNPVEALSKATDNHSVKDYLGGLQASFKILKGLKVSGSYSAWQSNVKNYNSGIYPKLLVSDYVRIKDDEKESTEKIFSAKLDYHTAIGNHHIDLMAGYTKYHQTTSSRSNVYLLGDSVPRNTSGWMYKSDTKFENIMALAQYDYQSKYFLSVGVLQEKSAFYKRTGSTENYPSVNVGWLLSEEHFLKNSHWIDQIRLHAGYGKCQRSLIARNNGYMYPSNLHGEDIAEMNFGADLAFFSNRLELSVEHYDRKTTDGIGVTKAASSSGYETIAMNGFDIQNKGWEINFVSKPLLNPVNWTLGFNAAINDNSLYFKGLIYRKAGDIYGSHFLGYSDEDKVIIKDYNSVIGNGVPEIFFGISNHISYKYFDFSVSVRGASGFEILDNRKIDFNRGYNGRENLFTVDQRDIINNESLRNTDYMVEKADYIKIGNISLGYSIPVKKRLLTNARVYVACNNVATFSSYKGSDPEAAGIYGLWAGEYHCDAYPDTQLYTLGLQVGF